MVIIGKPNTSALNDYIIVDSDLAFELHKAGFIPKYSDNGCLYFKNSKKLQKYLNSLHKNERR